ncbi:cis-3-chloroacrylic acid dehalogenase, partial [Pelagibacterales bacterium SAG-MED44]|nr:cis-3-chloroacrylic acid dehalogenase [Pelagibacterales bacterium SAG-MED44]
MPTYTVTNSNFNLSSKQQKNLAEGITKVHNVVTGADTYFAQVIFNKTKKNNHFMGGKKVKEPSIFLLGQIRAGRPKETKDKLISDLRDVIIKNSKLDET